MTRKDDKGWAAQQPNSTDLSTQTMLLKQPDVQRRVDSQTAYFIVKLCFMADSFIAGETKTSD